MKHSTATDVRMTVLLAKSEEESLRDAGKPYSEAVIQLCELFLTMTKPYLRKTYLELSEIALHVIQGLPDAND